MSWRFACLSWVLVAAWACVIFSMSANTGDDLHSGLGIVSTVYETLQSAAESVVGPSIDVVSPAAHFCEYAVFGALLANALRCHMPLGRAVVLAVACASAYGATDEFHQLFVPGRASDPLDWLVDTLGSGLGALAAWVALRRGAQGGGEGRRG